MDHENLEVQLLLFRLAVQCFPVIYFEKRSFQSFNSKHLHVLLLTQLAQSILPILCRPYRLEAGVIENELTIEKNKYGCKILLDIRGTLAVPAFLSRPMDQYYQSLPYDGMRQTLALKW